ncbi:MAG: carbohydrate ABC transporter permease [Chloroflexota bacterium]
MTPRRLGISLRSAAIVGITFAAAVVVIFPILWMVNAAFVPFKQIFAYPPQVLGSDTTLAFFQRLVESDLHRKYFLNSALLASGALLITIVLAMLAAYGFSRFRMKGGRFLLTAIVALLMLPSVTLVIPYYRLANMLHIYDSVLGLVLVDAARVLPISVWLLKGYIDAIPVDLEEAAYMDGCTRLQALARILVPLCVPGIVGTGTYAFIGIWNEYLLAIVLTDSISAQPLTVGLARMFGEHTRDWNSIMALSTLSSLPLVLLFIFFQRWVVKGMTAGAVK